MRQKPGKATLAVLEGVSSIVAVCAIPATFFAYYAANVSFSSHSVTIDTDQVRFYWTCVLLLAFAVAATFALGVLRGGGTAAFVWHTVVALAGLIVAVAFSVTQT